MSDFLFDGDLHSIDADANRLLALERRRQHERIILIASESICPRPVREALSSELTNIYAEGYPSTRMSVWEREQIGDVDRHMAFFRRYADRRYYKGTEICDFIETLAQKRCAEMFSQFNDAGVRAGDVFVNVQPLSGAPANNAVYTAFCHPGDTVMGIELSHGGHLTHGSPFNRSGKFHHIVSYGVNPTTGLLDYDEIFDLAVKHRPKLIIGGGSAYPWALDWKALRRAADASGALLWADVAHPAGLIVAGLYPNPIGHAHIITTTTHKTLCGPRGAVVITTDPRLAERIDMGVFPGEQGGPHVNSIAAKAVAFGLALTPEFRELQARVKTSAAVFAESMKSAGFKLVYGGTNSHLFLLDCKEIPGRKGTATLNGDIASRILDIVGITLNKNTVAGDKSAANPSGLRIGTTWISQLGYDDGAVRELADVTAQVLASIEPFDVIGGAGYLGRGKLPLDVMHEARNRVNALIHKFAWPELDVKVRAEEKALFDDRRDAPYPLAEILGTSHPTGDLGNAEAESAATQTGAALIDITAEGFFDIRGERALHFLQQLSTAGVGDLARGHGKETFFLQGDGRLIAQATVWRVPDDDTDQWRRYVVRVGATAKERLRDWLEGHNDGYIQFEPGDIHAKIDGPVALTDRRDFRSLARRLMTFALVGPKAGEIAAKAYPDAAGIYPGEMRRFTTQGREWFVARPAVADAASAVIEWHVDREHAAALWKRIVEVGGATPAGTSVWAKLSENRPTADTPAAALVSDYHHHEQRFDLTGVYFVGQSACPAPSDAPQRPRFAWSAPESALKRSCLYDEHKKLKGRMVPFAGWEMPVLYSSITEEHRIVRTGCGLFDVTHMGVFEFRGPGAQRFLDQLTSNFSSKLRPGNAHYSYLFDDTGHVLDDIFVYCRGPETYMMVVNAANADKDWEWIIGVAEGRYRIDAKRPWVCAESDGVQIVNLKEDTSLGDDRRADIAIQGPTALNVLLSLTDDAETKWRLETLAKSDLVECTLAGQTVIVARTGYTGEAIGFEVFPHPDRAAELWNAMLARHDDFGIAPTGLGARDSTRTEAGFPLYGHELAGEYGVTPTEAGYGSFVKRHKPFFIGRVPYLAAEAARSMEIIRFRLNASGARTVQPGSPVVNRKGTCIGYVTSAALVGSRQLGLAWVKRSFTQPGTKIGVFIPPHKKKSAADSAPTPAALQINDSVLLHEEATIITRFGSPTEFLTNLTE